MMLLSWSGCFTSWNDFFFLECCCRWLIFNHIQTFSPQKLVEALRLMHSAKSMTDQMCWIHVFCYKIGKRSTCFEDLDFEEIVFVTQCHMALLQLYT